MDLTALYKIREILAEEWDSFLEKSPERSVFSESWFFDCYEPLVPRRFAIERGGEAYVCFLVWQDRDGTVVADPLPYTQYQGFFFTEMFHRQAKSSRTTLGLQLLEFGLEELSRRFSILGFSSHWAQQDLRAFSWFHYHQPEKGRFRMDLYYSGLISLSEYADFSSYLSTIRKTRKQEYGKRQALGLDIRLTGNIDAFLRMYKATFDRQGLEVGSDQIRLVEKITRASLAKNRAALVGCYLGEELISAALFLFDGEIAYYLFGANDPEQRNLPGGTLVVLEGIRRAMEMGIRSVDVCGMNSPSRGNFKAGFCADLKAYHVMSWRQPTDTAGAAS